MESRICPGCGWTGPPDALGRHGGCPRCRYEIDGGLKSAAEMALDSKPYNDVRMDRFLPALESAGWIPTADALPPPGEMVLAFAFGRVDPGRRTSGGAWVVARTPTDPARVTHWRWFPPPPPPNL